MTTNPPTPKSCKMDDKPTSTPNPSGTDDNHMSTSRFETV